MLKFEELPSLPEGDRIMVQPEEPQNETEGRLVIPEIAQRHANVGRIVAAGLKALDILVDNGGKVGDRIWFGQYAGVWEEWDHIVKAGGDASCKHVEWSREPSLSGIRRNGYKCDSCGALRKQEPLLIMNIGDVLANADKAERVRNGEVVLILGASFDGKTQHVYQRPTPNLNTTNGVIAHAS